MSDGDKLLTVEGLAQMLQVSVRTVWRMVRDGQLPVQWVRQQMRFDWSKAKEALPSQRPMPLPRAVRPLKAGVTSMSDYLKREADSWPRN